MDINNIIKDTTHYVNDSIFANTFTNPIYVSFLMTFCIMLIIINIYSPTAKIKTGIYILFMTLICVFLHNKILLIKHKHDICNRESENIINSIEPTLGGLDHLSI